MSFDPPQLLPPAGPAPALGEDAARAAVLARLFHENNRELIGFLCTRLRSEQDAREVAQEAYARLLQLDLAPGAVSFLRGYLFKTAANLAIDRLRHRSTREAVHRRWEPGQVAVDPASTEQKVSNREQAELAVRYLEELPDKCHRAFVLYRVYEMDLQEVARTMGVSDRMVRYYVMEAMRHVRARLDGEQT